MNSIKHLEKNSNNPLKQFQKIEEEGLLSNSFYEASTNHFGIKYTQKNYKKIHIPHEYKFQTLQQTILSQI
jgi:hypothetical protein